MSACSTTTTNNSYTAAESGNTKVTFAAMPMKDEALHKALIRSLNDRKWTVTDSGKVVKAFIDNRGQHAVIEASINGDTVVFETKGSVIDGKPYVPVRYLDFLKKTMISGRFN